MATQIEAARLLVYQAAYLDSVGKPYGKQYAMAKLFASETAIWVITKAVQIFGVYGYSKEYPVERMMRGTKITEIYEGTSEVQRFSSRRPDSERVLMDVRLRRKASKVGGCCKFHYFQRCPFLGSSGKAMCLFRCGMSHWTGLRGNRCCSTIFTGYFHRPWPRFKNTSWKISTG